MEKVLILDANQRSALAATRALGAAGNLYIVTADSVPETLAGSSKYSKQHFVYPDPVKYPDRFVERLIEYCIRQNITYIQPVSEVTSRQVVKERERLKSVVVPFSDISTIESIADKSQLMAMATKLDIPIPHTRYFTSLSEWDSSTEMTYPYVIKPARSRFAHNGEWVFTVVRIVRSSSDLAKYLASDTYLQHTPFMIQEFIPGHGAGVFGLYFKGTKFAHFAHRRIREKPPSGGVSVLSEGISPDPTLMDYADRILHNVGWSGVAMTEFRISESGQPFLMEINTRLWGSLQLAIDSGVNFPALTYQAFTQTPVTCTEYTTGKKLRWLLGDLDSLYLFFKEKNNNFKQKLGRLFGFFIPSSNCRNEIFRLNDLQPAWFELKQYLNHFVRRT